MKTLHLTNAWHEKSGGIATFYRALIAEANRREHTIRLVVPATEDRIEEVGKFGKIYHILSPPSLFNSTYRTIYPLHYLITGSKLQQILGFERPDLVEISDKYTLNYLGALLRMRLIPTLDYRPVVVGLSQERMDDNVRAYFGSIPGAKTFSSVYMKWLYFTFFDHHIANSEYTAQELRGVAQGHVTPRGTWVRRMGVDLSHLSPKKRRLEMRRRLLQNFGAPEDATLLLYVGRLAPEKNLQLLFEVMARLASNDARDYRLLVVGDGIEREAWERKCEKTLSGKVSFIGHIRDTQVLADIYANADIFVHPNPREPFGIAPLEAMASALPLVAPNTGGVTSYANMENAWTMDADVDSFVAAIAEATTNRPLAVAKTEQALVTASQYRWENAAPRFLELYQELYLQSLDAQRAPTPVFSSTPPSRFGAALTNVASQTAIRGFKIWAKLVSGNRSEDSAILEALRNQPAAVEQQRRLKSEGRKIVPAAEVPSLSSTQGDASLCDSGQHSHRASQNPAPGWFATHS